MATSVSLWTDGQGTGLCPIVGQHLIFQSSDPTALKELPIGVGTSLPTVCVETQRMINQTSWDALFDPECPFECQGTQ